MKILIQQAFINDPQSAHNGQRADILIESGIIKEIGQGLDAGSATFISGNQLAVSPGWVDIYSTFGDPGMEYKETLETGAAAAAAGGFTDVFVTPNTKPVIDNKSQVEYVKHKSANLPVNIYPIGALTKKGEGHDLAEMYDMKSSGAIAFSDGSHPLQSAGILVKALQYVKAFNGVVMQIPDDKSMAPHGLMHEGVISTRLGLAGKPMMAEELLVARDIKLARYADSHIHFTGVTSPRSLDYIKRAKEAGLKVTCSVTPYHLFFTDEDLWNYDTNLKVFPPLRTAQERDHLRKAVLDGTIDCIATHHSPHETDSKVVEFEYAAFGMIGLETCYASLRSCLPELDENSYARLLSINARRIFGLSPASIEKNQPALVTIYEPDTPIKVTEQFLKSRSRNSAYLSKELTGKVLGIINGNKSTINN